MGANSSSISELANNQYLQKLCGTDIITKNDPFWNQLLSFSFQVPNNSADARLLEESTAQLCKSLAINNFMTGNFGALVHVFLIRAAELKASAQCEDNIFTWQTFNALFILRTICKYFIENLSEELLTEQFNALPKANEAPVEAEQNDENLGEELVNALVELLVDVPVLPFTYGLHLEAINALLILLSVQMYHPQHATKSAMFMYLMEGKTAIHACLLMKTLLKHFLEQEQCPPAMTKHEAKGALSGLASGLWNVMTLGLASGSKKTEEEAAEDALLANQSLLLILCLTNHCTNEREINNPYREALFSFTNSVGESNTSSPTEAVATFKIDFSKLYTTLCKTLKDDQTTLLVYLLIHRNANVKAFIMSRTNLDQLVMPLLKILYHAEDKNSHHIYMALIILLILSEDEAFNKAVHETMLQKVEWFKERTINKMTLGSLVVMIVTGIAKHSLSADKYLHTNCLAALANMSAHFHDLHPYVTQRIVSLFVLLSKKHHKLVDQLRHSAMQGAESMPEGESEQDHVQDLAVLEEVIRMVLEIINSCLSHSLHHNPNLLYTLLYQKEVFSQFRTHPTFQDIIQNIDTVLTYFSTQLEKHESTLSVHEVLEVIKQGARQFKRERLKKFPELKFKYVEEDQPEEFFIPYIWSLVYHSSNLYFNSSRIQLFSLVNT